MASIAGSLRRSSLSCSTLVASDAEDGQSEQGMDSGKEENTTYMCHLCREYDQLFNLPYLRSGKVFHANPCWSSMRSFERLMPKDEKSRLAYKHKMLHDPEAWRKEVLPFADKANRSSARLEAKRNFSEVHGVLPGAGRLQAQ